MKTEKIPFTLENYRGGEYKVKYGYNKVRILATKLRGKYSTAITYYNEEEDYDVVVMVNESELYLEKNIFEDGDYIYRPQDGTMFIFDKMSGNDYFCAHAACIKNVYGKYTTFTNDPKPYVFCNNMRMVTAGERSMLNDILKENGKVWDDKIKCIKSLNEENECPIHPFQKVLCRYKDSPDGYRNWEEDIFRHYKPNSKYPYNCFYANWDECIPYKGNEHLRGTNKDVEGEQK